MQSLLQDLRHPPRRLPRVYGSLPDFALTNQLGAAVSLGNLRGQTWVADFFFTRCAGPCPRMTQAMARLQAALRNVPGVRLVSITADPEHDTPTVLAQYAQRYTCQPQRWWFLTGDRRQVQQLARDGFKLVAQETDEAGRQAGQDLFIHSTQFVLVDGQGRIRGYYDSAEPEAQAKILKDLAALVPAG